MNFRIIAYIVGWVCNFQAMFMVLPCITALIYQEHEFFRFSDFHDCLPDRRSSTDYPKT